MRIRVARVLLSRLARLLGGQSPSLSYDPDAAGGTLTVTGGFPAPPSLSYDPDAAGGTLTVT